MTTDGVKPCIVVYPVGSSFAWKLEIDRQPWVLAESPKGHYWPDALAACRAFRRTQRAMRGAKIVTE